MWIYGGFRKKFGLTKDYVYLKVKIVLLCAASFETC